MSGSRLRVGLAVPRYAPFRGGMETYTEQAARALAARGAEVTVVTQAPRGDRLPLREHRDQYAIERHPLPVGSSFDLPSPAAILGATRRGRFDVIWGHSYHTPFAWVVAERAKDPFVLTPHYHGTGHTRLRALLHRPYRLAGRRLLSASRRIVVDTDAEAELILRHFPYEVRRDKLVIIPLAVDDPVRGWPPYPGDMPVILTVGRQEPYKRTELLIRAVGKLGRRGVRARLVVVGGGSGLANERDLAARIGAQDIVTFTGLVDDETLARWWASAALYATASRQEAFGIALAQALVARLPVVASDIPAHCEVLRRAGSTSLAELVNTADVTEQAAARYADAIARLLAASSPYADRVASSGLPTLAEMADQLLEVLASAAA